MHNGFNVGAPGTFKSAVYIQAIIIITIFFREERVADYRSSVPKSCHLLAL